MNYRIGTGDPSLWRDVGSGAWNSEPKTWEARVEAMALLSASGHARIIVGPNAGRHLGHYFNNSGTELQIDLAGLVNASSLAKYPFNAEIKAAMEYAQTLDPGEWPIGSTKFSGGVNSPDDSKDWYYAVGAYTVWGKAVVTVPSRSASPRLFSMEFEYCFFDQYNWNGDGSITFAGKNISDKDMARFHKQGLAKEFEMRGSYKLQVDWKPGSAPNITPITKSHLELAVGRGLW